MRSVLCGLLVTTGFLATPAFADQAEVCYLGFGEKASVGLIFDGVPSWRIWAGELSITQDGNSDLTYCTDVHAGLPDGICYTADISPADRTDANCRIAWILSENPTLDSHSAGVNQVAIWKLTEPAGTFSVAEADLDAEAEALVVASEGQCPASCDAGLALDGAVSEGSVVVTATFAEGDSPLADAEIEFLGSDGSIWTATTDSAGQASVEIPLDDTLSVTATTSTQWLTEIISPEGYQAQAQLAAPCDIEASATFEAAEEEEEPRGCRRGDRARRGNRHNARRRGHHSRRRGHHSRRRGRHHR